MKPEEKSTPDNKPPCSELLREKLKIGHWEASPFTMRTLILLETINSPYVRAKLGEDGLPIATVPSVTQLAEALYIFLHWDDPAINGILSDETRFANEIQRLSSEIPLVEFALINRQLNAIMAEVNRAIMESGIDKGNEKKDETGPSA